MLLLTKIEVSMKKIILMTSILIAVLVITCLLISNNKKIKNLKEKEIFNKIKELIEEQDRVNNELIELSKNKEITIDNAKIIKNPYALTPLSYVIVFNTKKNEEVSLYINGKFVNTFDKSRKHIIPLYGLINNSNNEVKIKYSDTEKVFNIKTEDVGITNLDIIKENNEIEYLSITSNNTFSSSVFDNNGNVVWNVNSNDFVDTKYLENGNILTIYTEEDYSYLLEIDYLGKIYNAYKINNHLHHTFYEFADTYALITYSEDGFNRNDLIYLVSRRTGNLIKRIDLYKILSSYSNKFEEEKKEDEDWAHINSLYLNEKENEIIVSLRKSNSIISINYDSNKINYIINSSNYFDNNFKDLIIKPNFDMLSQHSIYINENGEFVIFNNNVNRIKHLIDSVEVYDDNKESYPAIFKINKEDKTAELIWKYTYKDKKLFAPAFSSFEILENGNKLINYSCMIESVNGNYLFENQYMKIVILNNKDEIIFEAEKKDSVINVYHVDIYKNYKKQNKNIKVKIMEVK